MSIRTRFAYEAPGTGKTTVALRIGLASGAAVRWCR
jgi:hypothetical protein